jgi:hypothetical protein
MYPKRYRRKFRLAGSHPTPAEVLVDGGSAHVVRDRGSTDAVLQGQRL